MSQEKQKDALQQLGGIKEKVELLLNEKKELEVQGRMLQQNLQGFHKHLEALSIDEVRDNGRTSAAALMIITGSQLGLKHSSVMHGNNATTAWHTSIQHFQYVSVSVGGPTIHKQSTACYKSHPDKGALRQRSNLRTMQFPGTTGRPGAAADGGSQTAGTHHGQSQRQGLQARNREALEAQRIRRHTLPGAECSLVTPV